MHFSKYKNTTKFSTTTWLNAHSRTRPHTHTQERQNSWHESNAVLRANTSTEILYWRYRMLQQYEYVNNEMNMYELKKVNEHIYINEKNVSPKEVEDEKEKKVNK